MSALVVGGIALASFFAWYPHGLYRVSGLDRMLGVMLGIDLAAGPLLTLILYRPGKWGLKFDLAMVALAQCVFLGYGLHTLWEGRPVFLVGTPDVITVVFASEIDPADLENAARPEWRSLPWGGPHLVGSRMPDDPARRREVIEAFLAGGAGIERTPSRYTDYRDIAPDLLGKAHRLAVGGESDIPAAAIRKTGRSRDELAWVALVSRRGEGRMLVDATSGAPLLAISP